MIVPYFEKPRDSHLSIWFIGIGLVLLTLCTSVLAASNSQAFEARLRDHLAATYPESAAIHEEVVQLFVESARILDSHYGEEWPQNIEDWYWESTVAYAADLRPPSEGAGVTMDDKTLEERFQVLQSRMNASADSLKNILANDWGIEERREMEVSIDECRILLIKHLGRVISDSEKIAVDLNAVEGIEALTSFNEDLIFARYDSAIRSSPLSSSAQDLFMHDVQSALIRSRIEELVEVMHEGSRRLVLPIFNFGVYYPKYLERDADAFQSAMDSFTLDGDTLVLELDPVFELYGHGASFCHLYLGVKNEPRLTGLVATDSEPPSGYKTFDANSVLPRNSVTLAPAESFSLVRSRFASD